MPFTPKFVDLVRNAASVSGTGPVTVGAAATGFTSLADAAAPGEQFYYCLQGVDRPAEREVGRGTMQANGIVARQPISGSPTSFSSGAKTISLIAAAEWFTNLGQAGAGASVAATRGAIAAEPGVAGKAIILREAGREGLFAFDGSNLSAMVGGDPLQGVYVAPAADASGASGAWVRQYSGPLDVHWFGAVGNCTAPGAGTDDTAAFEGARDLIAARGGGIIQLGARRYRLTRRLVFTRNVSVRGVGHTNNPGIVGGVSYSGVNLYEGSVLVFDANVAGMIFYAQTDGANAATVKASYDALGLASPEWKYKSAQYSTLRDFMMIGGGGTNTGAHGVEYRCIVAIENVRVIDFAGSGFQCDASTHSETTAYGLADGSLLTRCIARANGLHGFLTRGNDANIITFIGCDSANNGGCGYLDKGQLGNAYLSCHAATNNQSFAAPATPQRSQALADWAGLSDQYAGGYVATSAVAAHSFTGCYVEGGQGNKCQLEIACDVRGGNLTSDINWEANEKSFILNSGTAMRRPIAGYNKLGSRQVTGGLGQTPSSVGNVVQWFGSIDDTATMDAFKLTYQFNWTGTWALNYANSGGAQIYELINGLADTPVAGFANAYALGLPNGFSMGFHHISPRFLPAQAAMPSAGKYRAGDWVPNSVPAMAAGKVLLGWSRLTTGTAHVAGTDWASHYGLTGDAFGYAAGVGGAVAQATSKATGVTLNKPSGQVTMNAASLAASASASFTLTNSAIAATDTINLNIASGATANSYIVGVDQVAAGSCRIHLRNISGGALAEALVLNFALLKAVAA